MTQMSDPHRSHRALNEHNCSGLLARAPVARAVHGFREVVRLALAMLVPVGGCVIPPNLSVDNQDASVNSPPAITLVSSDQQALPEPGPVSFARGTGSLFLELLDSDLGDTLQVGVFVNYTLDDPSPARSTCTAAPGGQAKRAVTCDLTALCQMDEVGLMDPLNMSVVVFDRQLVEGGTNPPFQEMKSGGLSTSRFYFLFCTDPPT
jgi:hypothetical protein